MFNNHLVLSLILNIKTMINAIFIIGIAFLSSCSLDTSLVKKEDVIVERVNSNSVIITRAYLQHSNKTKVLRGELKRRVQIRGSIPGHLHIELFNSEGVIFQEANVGYRRNGVTSGKATFFLEIPGDLSSIKSVRVTHHDRRSHMPDTEKSPWRDVH